MDHAGYRRVFRDIVEGRTDVQVGENLYYIKHLSALDQVEIDNIKSKYFEEAVKRGIPKKEENLKKLKEEGNWTDEQEIEIKRQEAFIDQLQKNKTQLVLKTQIDRQNEAIQETRKKINALQAKKQSLIGVNAEDYSEKRANDYYIIKSFYKDKELKNRVFEREEDFNELYSEEISVFVNAYNQTFLAFEELKIQEMILQDFYYIYFPFSDDTVGFFGSIGCATNLQSIKINCIYKNI